MGGGASPPRLYPLLSRGTSQRPVWNEAAPSSKTPGGIYFSTLRVHVSNKEGLPAQEANLQKRYILWQEMLRASVAVAVMGVELAQEQCVCSSRSFPPSISSATSVRADSSILFTGGHSK